MCTINKSAHTKKVRKLISWSSYIYIYRERERKRGCWNTHTHTHTQTKATTWCLKISEMTYVDWKLSCMIPSLTENWAGSNLSLRCPTCLTTLKSCDTMKQSVCGRLYIYIYIYIHSNPSAARVISDIMLIFKQSKRFEFFSLSSCYTKNKDSSALLFIRSWREDSWKQTFSKRDVRFSFFQDLNSGHRIHLSRY